MAFARLAPHCGLTPVYGLRIGNSDMRGGFSWASLGSSLSSGLSRIGSAVANTARQIGNSQAFQQAKSGFLQSGILENVGQLAGQAVSSLVDVGRIKLEQDVQNLRDKVLGERQQHQGHPMPYPHIVQPPPEPIVRPPALPPVPALPALPPPIPLPPPAVVEPPVVAPAIAAPSLAAPVEADMPPASEPVADTVVDRRRRNKKRKRVSGWGAALDSMVGDGVRYGSQRYCY
ncbi:pVI protein [Duck adenovirus 1]|uniref:PVI protein n=2 Tax=Duck atadenovirus A TaxID=130328 RepID=O11420_DADV1|nr:pVI protein [Duck atadenovirus A]AP_000087.1 pVI [Duck atadenovirus A]AGS11273.1 pVI protein [Duck adenovirus 1]AJA72333.1 pVI protein [Duck adenovirus 1]AJA72362.1 pVI protein [Duck adenovirus 1]AJA72391.1 pVI protein [Duck adenovirus 1]AJA72420.1 pVI protein [Duck adenovirus 1]